MQCIPHKQRRGHWSDHHSLSGVRSDGLVVLETCEAARNSGCGDAEVMRPMLIVTILFLFRDSGGECL